MDQENINLDFDDDLEADALCFGQVVVPAVAQGDVTEQLIPPVHHEEYISIVPSELQRALIIIREVYGETNCKYSESFCHFVADVLKGGSTIKEAKELQLLIREDRDRFSGRCRTARLAGKEEYSQILRARWMAIWGAGNIIRAVINWRKGLRYEIWIEKALYRITLTEKDKKSLH